MCTVPHHATQYHTTLYSTTPHPTTQYHTPLHSTTPRYTVPHHTTPHHTTQYPLSHSPTHPLTHTPHPQPLTHPTPTPTGTVAEGAPIVPISAQLKYNIEVICEYITKKIPKPVRDFISAPRLIVIRSFDVNKPGSEVDDLKGGVAGGSILRGVLKVSAHDRRVWYC